MTKRSQNRYVVPLLLLITALIAGIIILMLHLANKSNVDGGKTADAPTPNAVDNGNIKAELAVEAGSEKPAPSDFIIKDEGKPAFFVGGEGAIDISRIGRYPVSIEYDGKTYDAFVNIKDTVPPTAVAQSVTINIGETVIAESFVSSITDATNVQVSFKDAPPDTSKPGEYPVAILLVDEGGNKTELTVALTVVADVTPPVIEGAKDIIAYVGEAVAYRSGVTVTDDIDPTPTLAINTDSVDLSRTGIYKATYTASDASGNISTAEITVTVREKTDSEVDAATVFAEADELIASIITGDMTKRQQVEAIYRYARTYWSYSSHSDKTDWLQGAHAMLEKSTGDCYNYFAATKLLFERLGIDNIDVRKVKNHPDDSDHYWSLVSLDGGVTWYHFDSTPRKGEGDDFCLVTDAFIDAYSDAHKKSHNRDKSLYPATPLE